MPATTRGRCGPAKRAFSLPELLIAIAIIALLSSVLLPSLGRARDEASLTMCRTRLRNMSIGLVLYAEDNASHLPVAEQLDNPHTQLIAALDGRYLPEKQGFYCPSLKDPELTFSPENFTAGNIGYFYFGCRKATSNRAVSTFLRWHVAWQRELRLGGQPDRWVMSDCWFSGQPSAHWYYKKGVNYLTLDGAVRMVQQGPRQAFR